MLLLGLLLLAAAGAFTGLLIAGNLNAGPDYSVTLFGNHLATMSSFAIFLAGLALALIFALGYLLATGSVRRHARRQVAADATRGGPPVGREQRPRHRLIHRPGH
ncbi:hypothetical protein ACIGXM_09615 [Kitasatospora sp. NPDC052896]|uniref:hypothetical protein n=1 Tax=Kitasatospora sp. NPDC052896 TaxID=3364061 RepID=UPI0037C856E0